jgi:hypothetical protein
MCEDFPMDTSRMVVVCASIARLGACSHEQVPSIPPGRPILAWHGSAAQDQDRRDLPPGFSAPDEHACANDITRIYLGVLFLHGDVQVKWHLSAVIYGCVRMGWK